jgi:transposase
MPLSEHDLKQLDEAAIYALDLESLRRLAVQLLGDLIEACDRLRQNPSNSSRPPSSQPPWSSAAESDAAGCAHDP